MRWVKASERLPEIENEYCICVADTSYKYIARFEEGVFYNRDYNDHASPYDMSGLRWLDESPEDKVKLTDKDFHDKKEEAKKDFNLACDLYRGYVGSAETKEERLRRIRMFRCG
jgi:hypothetical protein